MDIYSGLQWIFILDYSEFILVDRRSCILIHNKIQIGKRKRLYKYNNRMSRFEYDIVKI